MASLPRILRVLGLIAALRGSAEAAPSLQLEALAELPENQAIVRTVALTEMPGKINVTALVDYIGNSSDDFYSRVGAGREISQGLGPKLEWHGGSVMDDLVRFGPEYVPNLGENVFLDVMLYPLTIGSDGRVQEQGRLSTFARVDLPWRLYAENATDITFSYAGGNPPVTVASETTIGRTLVGNLAAEVQHAHNINLPGEQARLGVRYNF